MHIVEHFPPGDTTIPDEEKVLFLAGPIQGAPNWQQHATDVARRQQNGDTSRVIHIANPRREYLDGSFDYLAQVNWEKFHLQRAKRNEAIMVWFAAQDHSVPYEEGREYAKTTKDELNRIIGWKDEVPNLNLFVGIEPGFKSLSRYKMTCLDEYGLGTYTDLDTLVKDTVRSLQEAA